MFEWHKPEHNGYPSPMYPESKSILGKESKCERKNARIVAKPFNMWTYFGEPIAIIYFHYLERVHITGGRPVNVLFVVASPERFLKSRPNPRRFKR